MWENRSYDTQQIVTQNMITCILFLFLYAEAIVN